VTILMGINNYSQMKARTILWAF